MVTPDELKEWGCRSWSDEERAELARIATELGLVAPDASYWPELTEAFREYLG
jgi:hypothetical protein